MGGVLVVGSYAVDMTARGPALPKAGETVRGDVFFTGHGGKGSNQAVASARAGAKTALATRVGDDVFGREALAFFKTEGVDAALTETDGENPTGTALICVDAEGNNQIMMAPGACAAFSPAGSAALEEAMGEAGCILFQMEINRDALEGLLALAARVSKAQILLNPAPYMEISREALACAHIITPNEHEAALLCGFPVETVEDAERACAHLCARYVRGAAVTLGQNGAFVQWGGEKAHIRAPRVAAVDTTGAGDVFNGWLAAELSRGEGVFDAANAAVRAASFSVTRRGAAVSAPHRKELEGFV